MIIEQASRIRGTISVPGDKSIAHRALILGAMARGRHEVSGLPDAEDVWSTIECLRTLGVLVEETPDGRILVIARTPAGGHRLDAVIPAPPHACSPATSRGIASRARSSVTRR